MIAEGWTLRYSFPAPPYDTPASVHPKRMSLFCRPLLRARLSISYTQHTSSITSEFRAYRGINPRHPQVLSTTRLFLTPKSQRAPGFTYSTFGPPSSIRAKQTSPHQSHKREPSSVSRTAGSPVSTLSRHPSLSRDYNTLTGLVGMATAPVDTLSMDTYEFPTQRLRSRIDDPERMPLVLIACGSFSPITVCPHHVVSHLSSTETETVPPPANVRDGSRLCKI